ncbi:MAG: hypothetical protein M1825_002374 [Sarcosagium campestre]|nr:MAG: hypothetical protein M1825_002374 [Sarcosagium campestre]
MSSSPQTPGPSGQTTEPSDKTPVLQKAVNALADLGTPLSPPQNGLIQVPTTYLESTSPTHTGDTVPVPEYFESLQTLLYIGFDEDTARTVWEYYQRVIQSFPGSTTLFDTAVARIEGGDVNARGDDEDYDEALKSMGIEAELRGDILDEEFKEFRLKESAKFWVLGVFNARMTVLKELDDMITTMAEESLAERRQQQSSSLPDCAPESSRSGQQQPSSSSDDPPQCAPQ